MKKKFSMFIPSLFIGLFACISSSLSWFVSDEKLKSVDKLGGEFASTYFHSGDGTAESPFEITKPFHYENLIKLHYEHTEFAEEEYYFRFGSTNEDMPGEPESPMFYGTDNKGNVDTTTTSKTLNLGGKILPPLGTDEYPFIGHIDGSGLTVSNFTVAGKGYYDVGIFGFVNSEANEDGTSPISNCYWKDFSIDTNETSTSVHNHDTDTYPEQSHYSFESNDTCEVGYLAGHTVYASCFSDCYVNNCKINGTGSNDQFNSTYGYFGMCENDYLGGSTGKGHDYDFLLDSEAIYRSTRKVYQDIKDNPIRTRNGYTEYTTPINEGVDPEIYQNAQGAYVASHPLSDAISFDGNRTYTLNGDTRSSSAERNYSFSTIGYQPLKSQAEQIEYETYYLKNGAQTKLPETFTFRDDWKGQNIDATTRDSTSTLKENGDFVYYNGSNWKYIHSENSTQTESREFTARLSIDSGYSLTGFGALKEPSLISADVYLFIDGKQIVHQDLKNVVNVERKDLATRLRFSNIVLSQTDYNVNLTRGIHYFCYFFCANININQGRYSWLGNSNNSISCTTGGRMSVTAGTFNITQAQFDAQRSNRIISNVFTATSSGHAGNSTSSNPIELYSIDSRAPSIQDIPAYVSSNTFQVDIYGKNIKTETAAILSDASLKFRKDEGTTTEYDEEGNPIEVYWYKWIAYNTPQKQVDYDASSVFLSDNPDITPRISEGEYVSGYEWKNIDIVGGGVSFYYRNIAGFFDVRVISIPAESTNNYVCSTIESSDIGEHFYATKYCPCSIVLYFNNSANAADAMDITLGDISFEYINASFLGTSWINISVPSFKKGNGNFVDLDRFGTQTGGVLDVRTTYSCEIDENGAKACSFCALDKKGDILGIFDANGNPSTGFLDSSDNPIKEKLMQIDTYVMALGTDSYFNISSWITKVDFNYKSNEGYGGSFGSVEFRDASEKVTSTIFNFFVNVPSNNTFSIVVLYTNQSTTIEGVEYEANTYVVTISSKVSLTFNMYLYDSNYQFAVNGTIYNSSQVGLVYTP